VMLRLSHDSRVGVLLVHCVHTTALLSLKHLNSVSFTNVQLFFWINIATIFTKRWLELI